MKTRIAAPGQRSGAPFVLFLLGWLAVVALALQMKWTILSATGGGFDFLARANGVADPQQVALLQRLALLRQDLLLVGVIAPAVLLLVLSPFGARARASLVAGASVVLLVVLFIELKSYWEVGTFVSARVLTAGLLGSGRKYALHYVPFGSVVKLGISIGFAVLASWVVAYLARRNASARSTTIFEQSARVGATVPVVITAALYCVPHPATPFDVSAAYEALTAFAGRVEMTIDGGDIDVSSPETVVAAYRRLANAPVPNHPGPFWGKAAGYDVIVFLYESLPWACASGAAGTAALPNFVRLKRHAFVTQEHYTTHPYSRLAYFSIFSGLYPAPGLQGTKGSQGAESDSLFLPGVVRTTLGAGYRTAMFNPEAAEPWEGDDERYQALGFQRHVHPPDADGWRVVAGSLDSLRTWRRGQDLATLEILKQEIIRATEVNQRYIFAFNPQMTHGPWPDVDRAADEAGACARGLPLFQQVDDWLGQIVNVLTTQQTLDRTLIVALGDHGLRTRREFPPFWGGTLDDITFHVPLLLYAPGVLDTPVEIPWTTSHIDIAPSVLDLLGLAEGRALEEGSPMWEPALSTRKTYFFARGFLGADGLRDGNTIVMVKYFFGGVSNPRWQGKLRFRHDDLLQEPSPESRALGEQVFQMSALHDALAKLMTPERTRALFHVDRSADAPP